MDITAPIRPPEQRRRRRRGGFLLRFVGFLFAAGMIVFVAGAGIVAFVLWKVSKDLPDYDVLAKYEPPVMTRIHANDGRLISEFSRERRIYVPLNAVPERVIQAFISAEDKNFFQHGGLDIQGIIRAVVTNLNNMQSGRRDVGASTITQQVAKNFLLSSDVTMERKLKEAILAIRIERSFTKKHILELYMNEIYLGIGAYGVAAAAEGYWDKALSELTLADAAYLAVLPKAPNNYHPFRHTERALSRRNWVLDQMVANGYATRDEAETAKAQPLNVKFHRYGAKIVASEYFAEEVRREILDRFGEEKLYGGGLSVRTTLDPRLQAIARKSLVDALVAYDRRHGWRGPLKTIDLQGDWGETLAKEKVLNDVAPWRLAVVLEVTKDKAVVGLRPTRNSNRQVSKDRQTGVVPSAQLKWARAKLKPGNVIYVSPREPTKDEKKNNVDVEGQWALQQVPAVSGGLVAMDPHTGRVLAIAGGFSFAQSEFNRAVQAHRQPGSAFKPIIYSTALDNGYTPSSIIVDGPIAIDQGAGMPKWRPRNYGGSAGAGPSTLRFGIEKSRNLMTVRLSNEIGMPIIAEYARRFGVYDNLMPILSMSLGAGETTVLRMVTAYSMLANGGKQVRATFIDRIQDRYGRTVWRHDTRDCTDCSAREWAGQSEPELIDDRKQIIDPMTAYQITSIMEGVVQRGTARRLKALGRPIAGKTGTTNDEKDAWFVGFTPDLVVGAYVGFDQPKPMGRGETGGHVAAPAFRDFITAALADTPPIPFRTPPGISLVRVNHKSGRPASPGDKTAIMEAFKPGSEPFGAVPIGAAQDGELSPAGDGLGQAPAQDAFPGAAPGQFPAPRRGVSRPVPGGAFPSPGSDRSLTSGTGGLY